MARKHAVVIQADGLFTCVLTIYLTTFSITGITLSNDKPICEYRGGSHVADRGRVLTWPGRLHLQDTWSPGQVFNP
jgi:hypothetical protein